MSERKNLLRSLTETIRDYRAGEVPTPTPPHVERWISQFDKKVQLPILRELDHVLRQTYCSRDLVRRVLRRLLTNDRLAGGDPCRFWRQTNFFRHQGHGESQQGLLVLLDEELRRRCGFSSAECGKPDGPFVYLDDGIFSGDRVIQDVTTWIREAAPTAATVHLIVLVRHTLGAYWVQQRVRECAEGESKAIKIKIWSLTSVENRRICSRDSDVLWPTAAPGHAAVRSYQQDPRVGEIFWRPVGGDTGLFSSESSRSLLEREFLVVGARLIARVQNPNAMMRPLGYSRFGFGFGSMTATYRNCPNNAPLALWWGDPTLPPSHPLHSWYPLLPRKIHPAETSGG